MSEPISREEFDRLCRMVEAQEFLIAGLGSIVLAHTGHTGQTVYNLLASSGQFTTNEAVLAILRQALSARPARKRPALRVIAPKA